MDASAPALLLALEHSALGAAIRQSVWIYPLANVLHVMALTIFAGAVAVMDLRLLGAFPATEPAGVVRPARKVAVAALAVMASTGLVLFTAEASHISLNAVFLAKAALIALGLLNAIAVSRALDLALVGTPAHAALPGRVRSAAALSLAIWLLVAGLGRAIAYF